jgi:hypothetical protein
MYAPPWARETPQQTPESIIEAIEQLRQERARAAAAPAESGTAARAEPRQPRDRDEPEPPLVQRPDPGSIEAAMADAVRATWTPHSLDPVTMPEPPPAQLSGPSPAMVARLGGAVAVAAGVALFVTGALPLPSISISLGLDEASKVISAVAQPIDARQARAPASVPAPPAADPPPRVALAVATLPANPPPPAPVVVAMPVKTTPVVPPLPAEILTAFASIDTASVAPRGPKIDAPLAVAPVPKLPQLRAIEREELAGIVKRGEMLLLEGDVSSARLLLRRAAEAGDANATLMLAGTYDRAELARLKVIGIVADDAQAKHWYSKAVEHGSAEAVRRLQQLAQR